MNVRCHCCCSASQRSTSGRSEFVLSSATRLQEFWRVARKTERVHSLGMVLKLESGRESAATAFGGESAAAAMRGTRLLRRGRARRQNLLGEALLLLEQLLREGERCLGDFLRRRDVRGRCREGRRHRNRG